jgi:hypothetical protein
MSEAFLAAILERNNHLDIIYIVANHLRICVPVGVDDVPSLLSQGASLLVECFPKSSDYNDLLQSGHCFLVTQLHGKWVLIQSMPGQRYTSRLKVIDLPRRFLKDPDILLLVNLAINKKDLPKKITISTNLTTVPLSRL